MSNKNLELWQLVEKTDVTHTKKAQKGAYHFTSIAPMSQFKKATEVFGIQGIGWGIKPESEVFHEQTIGDSETVLLNYDAILFFKFNGECGEIAVHATEKLAYKTQGAKGYLKIDDESRKKVVTNAKTKGLSELGFNADVFMGMFENHDYYNEIALEQGNQKQTDAEEKNIKLREELEVKVNVFFNKMKEAKNMTTLNAVTTTYKNQIIRACNEAKMNNEAFVNKLGEIYSEVKTKLEGVAK